MNFENSFLLFIISVLMRFKEEKYGNLYKKNMQIRKEKTKFRARKSMFWPGVKRESFFFFFELGLTPCKTE